MMQIGLRRILCRSRLYVVCILFVCAYVASVIWTSVMNSKVRRDNTVNDYISNQEDFLINEDNLNLRHQGKFESATAKCKERRNLVFIKCMKCATETMGTIIRQFGFVRNLSFVTPRKNKMYLGWPYLMTRYDYRPSSRGYNIIMEHAIYNKTFMENLMPQDTIYVTILREPFSHVKSTIHYFKILEIAEIPGDNPLSEYFHNIEQYDSVYKRPDHSRTRYCIPNGFSMTKNLLSHCLGMPLSFPEGRDDISHDHEAVRHYIQQLGQDFSLVMLVEYFHESLILLKRKMCWTFRDIVYKSVNGGKYSYKKSSHDPELVSIHKKWSEADYALYDYFNKTFWKHVADQGADFFEEVSEYSKIQTKVTGFCKLAEQEGELHVGTSKWSPGFTFNKEDCEMSNMLKKIQARHDKDEKEILLREKVDQEPKALC